MGEAVQGGLQEDRDREVERRVLPPQAAQDRHGDSDSENPECRGARDRGREDRVGSGILALRDRHADVPRFDRQEPEEEEARDAEVREERARLALGRVAVEKRDEERDPPRMLARRRHACGPSIPNRCAGNSFSIW